MMSDAPVALVVGLCAHGLAITRSLSSASVRVIAIESNKSLPGVSTSTAEVIIVDEINGPGLIESLVKLAPVFSRTTAPVLFLTNDNMIQTVGSSYDSLGDFYRLSWACSRISLLPLLKKEHVRQRCIDVGMLHPESRFIRTREDFNNCMGNMALPVIFKPDKPVSNYKTLVVDHQYRLDESWKTISQSLPTIVQEFIPGDDTTIYFAALYLEIGEVVARYEGRKLRSRPMGHTTVAIGEQNDTTHALAQQFFAGLKLSGPVSLEVKKDPDGAFWVIEPTVGRTDFWVGLCINDGVDLPLIEYNQQREHAPGTSGAQQDRSVWMNEERDPAALIWLMFRYPRLLFKRKVAVYFYSGDYRPFLTWVTIFLKRIPKRLVGKLMRMRPNIFSVLSSVKSWWRTT